MMVFGDAAASAGPYANNLLTVNIDIRLRPDTVLPPGGSV